MTIVEAINGLCKPRTCQDVPVQDALAKLKKLFVALDDNGDPIEWTPAFEALVTRILENVRRAP